MRYRVLRGLNYPAPSGVGEKRAEPEDVVDDLPKDAVGWLTDMGYIEPVPAATPAVTRGGKR